MSRTSSLCSASFMDNTSCKRISNSPQRAYCYQAYSNMLVEGRAMSVPAWLQDICMTAKIQDKNSEASYFSDSFTRCNRLMQHVWWKASWMTGKISTRNINISFEDAACNWFHPIPWNILLQSSCEWQRTDQRASCAFCAWRLSISARTMTVSQWPKV
jgi:hypothetical protein